MSGNRNRSRKVEVTRNSISYFRRDILKITSNVFQVGSDFGCHLDHQIGVTEFRNIHYDAFSRRNGPGAGRTSTSKNTSITLQLLSSVATGTIPNLYRSFLDPVISAAFQPFLDNLANPSNWRAYVELFEGNKGSTSRRADYWNIGGRKGQQASRRWTATPSGVAKKPMPKLLRQLTDHPD